MPDSVIRILCPNLSCQRILAVPSTARGKLVRCRSCGTTIRIPKPKESVEAAPTTDGKQPSAPQPDASKRKDAA